jgi:hypothetical protein
MGYDMLIRFLDQSPSFVHGFEAGQWYLRLQDAARLNVEAIDTRSGFPIHRANEDVIIDIAKSMGFVCSIFPVGAEFDDTYTHCRFTRPAPDPEP